METLVLIVLNIVLMGIIIFVVIYHVKIISRVLERHRLLLNDFESKIDERFSNYLLHSYKPKFEYGDMVEWYSKILGTSNHFTGKVVNVECIATEYFVWERLTVDTGTSIMKVDGCYCVIKQTEIKLT